MGNKANSGALQKELLGEYLKTTRFNKSELKQLYKQFSAEAPGGQLSKSDFASMSTPMGLQDPFVLDLVFNAFDRSRAGCVGFGDYATGMSVMTRGTPDEKAEFAFRMLDTGGKGNLTRDDLRRVAQQLFAAAGSMGVDGLLPAGGDDPEQLADKLFAQLDSGKKGSLTLEEYRTAALKNPSVYAALTAL